MLPNVQGLPELGPQPLPVLDTRTYCAENLATKQSTDENGFSNIWTLTTQGSQKTTPDTSRLAMLNKTYPDLSSQQMFGGHRVPELKAATIDRRPLQSQENCHGPRNRVQTSESRVKSRTSAMLDSG